MSDLKVEVKQPLAQPTTQPNSEFPDLEQPQFGSSFLQPGKNVNPQINKVFSNDENTSLNSKQPSSFKIATTVLEVLWRNHTRKLTFIGTAAVAGAIYGGLWANPATVAALHAILLKAMPFLAPLIKANPVLGTFLLVALAILAVAFTAYLGASIYAGIRDREQLTQSDAYLNTDNKVSSLLRAGIFGLTGRVVKSFELSCCGEKNNDDYVSHLSSQ
jgi:hypothetical protein